jgi:hypothetical protein
MAQWSTSAVTHQSAPRHSGHPDSTTKRRGSLAHPGQPARHAIGLDDLIRIKRYIGRPKDRESLLQLEAIKRLRGQEGLR